MIFSDQISADIVENITKYLYSVVSRYRIGYFVNEYPDLFMYRIFSSRLFYRQKYVILDFKQANDMNNWIHDFKLDIYQVSETKHIRGGVDRLNLRSVCKAFNRPMLRDIIGEYGLQFQKEKYTFILFENLRFNENWIVFPDHKNHLYYKKKFIFYKFGLQDYYLPLYYIDSGISYTCISRVNRRIPTIPFTPTPNPQISELLDLFKYRSDIVRLGRPLDTVGISDIKFEPHTDMKNNQKNLTSNKMLNIQTNKKVYNRKKRDNNINIQKIKRNNNYACNSGSRKNWHR